MTDNYHKEGGELNRSTRSEVEDVDDDSVAV